MRYSLHTEYRKTSSKKAWTLILWYILVAVCCVIHIASESKAEDGQGEKGSHKDSWRYIGSSDVVTGGNTTKISVVGGGVLVPATLAYKGYEAKVLLLLDTGSSRTAISAEIADRLNVNPIDARKARAQVVGGGVIEVRQLRLTSITVGPHTEKEVDILIVQHRGPPVKYDGLLGMDLLRGLKYKIDFEKQILIWE